MEGRIFRNGGAISGTTGSELKLFLSDQPYSAIFVYVPVSNATASAVSPDKKKLRLISRKMKWIIYSYVLTTYGDVVDAEIFGLLMQNDERVLPTKLEHFGYALPFLVARRGMSFRFNARGCIHHSKSFDMSQQSTAFRVDKDMVIITRLLLQSISSSLLL